MTAYARTSRRRGSVLEPEGEEYGDVGGFVVVVGRCRVRCSKDVAGRAGEACELLEPSVAVADLAHDQQRVAIADHVERVGDGADPPRWFDFRTH